MLDRIRNTGSNFRALHQLCRQLHGIGEKGGSKNEEEEGEGEGGEGGLGAGTELDEVEREGETWKTRIGRKNETEFDKSYE